MKQTKNKKKQKTICIIIDDYTNNELISLLNLATKLKKEINFLLSKTKKTVKLITLQFSTIHGQ